MNISEWFFFWLLTPGEYLWVISWSLTPGEYIWVICWLLTPGEYIWVISWSLTPGEYLWVISWSLIPGKTRWSPQCSYLAHTNQRFSWQLCHIGCVNLIFLTICSAKPDDFFEFEICPRNVILLLSLTIHSVGDTELKTGNELNDLGQRITRVTRDKELHQM